jgi:hypothetical protein
MFSYFTQIKDLALQVSMHHASDPDTLKIAPIVDQTIDLYVRRARSKSCTLHPKP